MGPFGVLLLHTLVDVHRRNGPVPFVITIQITLIVAQCSSKFILDKTVGPKLIKIQQRV